MRAFWSFMVVLVLATAGLYVARVNGVFDAPERDAARMQLPAWEGAVVEDVVVASEADAGGSVDDSGGAVGDDAEEAGGGVDPGVVERLRARVRGEDAPAADDGVSGESDDGVVGPAYTVGDGGALTVAFEGGAVTLSGDGSAGSPYVVPWDVLRGVQRVYAPRDGRRELPAWLDALDGKHVTIEGNTLVPLVQSVTTELLVMQNPWDGCCIGVPPTPYDAIEVKLERGVKFSTSATGYGRVEGVFEVDPYEVSGWLMGLFLINEASYTSGSGEALPGL